MITLKGQVQRMGDTPVSVSFARSRQRRVLTLEGYFGQSQVEQDGSSVGVPVPEERPPTTNPADFPEPEEPKVVDSFDVRTALRVLRYPIDPRTDAPIDDVLRGLQQWARDSNEDISVGLSGTPPGSLLAISPPHVADHFVATARLTDREWNLLDMAQQMQLAASAAPGYKTLVEGRLQAGTFDRLDWDTYFGWLKSTDALQSRFAEIIEGDRDLFFDVAQALRLGPDQLATMLRQKVPRATTPTGFAGLGELGAAPIAVPIWLIAVAIIALAGVAIALSLDDYAYIVSNEEWTDRVDRILGALERGEITPEQAEAMIREQRPEARGGGFPWWGWALVGGAAVVGVGYYLKQRGTITVVAPVQAT